MKTAGSGYIRVDLQRAFCTWRMPFAIIGICLFFLYNSEKTDAVTWVSSIGSVAVLVMGALMLAIYPYGAAFCDDMEYRYDRQLMIRKGSFSYVCSKMLAVFVSSAAAMFAGFFIPVLILMYKYGAPNEDAVEMLVDCQGWYCQFVVQGQYIRYFICAGLQIASLAGTLAVIGLTCSLFVRNRMLVYILPIAIMYIEDIMVQRFWGWEKGSTFSLRSMGITTLEVPLKGQSWQLYYFEIFMVLLCAGAIAYWKTERRIRN